MIANIDFVLQPKQAVAWNYMLDLETERICYGGAKKGGKSFWGRAASLFRRCAFPGSAGLIIRETEDEVMANHWLPLQQQAQQWGIECRPNVNDMTLTFPQFKRGIIPSQIFFGYGKSLDHVNRYQGNMYLDIFYDETTNLIELMVKRINGQLANEHWPQTIAKSFYTCNPGGVGTAWVLRDLIEEATRLPRTVFVQAFVDDNPIFLKSDPRFKERLREEYRDQPHIIEQWLEGNWYASPSDFFVFNRKAVLRPVQVPYWAKFYAGVDYGHYPDPFAVVWAAKWRDPITAGGKHHVHFFHELYKHRLELDEQADAVKDAECLLREKYPFFPPRIMRYTGHDSNKKIPGEKQKGATRTIRDVWAKHKFFTQSVMAGSRETDWALWRFLLKRGIMTVDPSCMALIQEMSSAQYEKTAQGVTGTDMDQRTGDHALEGSRYLLRQTFGYRFVEQYKKMVAGLHDEPDEPFSEAA